MEDAAIGRLGVASRSVDHVALLCRLTVGCLSTRVYQWRRPCRVAGRGHPPGRGALERQLEPGRPLRVGQVVADPLDRRPVAGPDDLAWASSSGSQRASSCSCESVGSASGATRTAKHGRRHDGVDRRLVELVDEVEVVERLDVRRGPKPVSSVSSRSAPIGDALAGLERSRDALPQSRQDAPGRAAQQQDLDRLDAPALVGDPEDPAVDEIGPERAHRPMLLRRCPAFASSTPSGWSPSVPDGRVIGARSPSGPRPAARAAATSTTTARRPGRSRAVRTRAASRPRPSGRAARRRRIGDRGQDEPDRELDRQRRAGRPGRRQLGDGRRELRRVGDDRGAPHDAQGEHERDRRPRTRGRRGRRRSRTMTIAAIVVRSSVRSDPRRRRPRRSRPPRRRPRRTPRGWPTAGSCRPAAAKLATKNSGTQVHIANSSHMWPR